MYLLGIDVGTTNWKVVAYDHQGAPVASFRCSCRVHQHEDGFACYWPKELWATLAGGIRSVVEQLGDPGAVDGLAVGSIGESGVLLDAAGEPLFPSLAWFDPCTRPQARRWLRGTDVHELYAVTGFAPQHIASVNKLLWLREEHPDVCARARRWLCIADYVAFRLSGEAAMDYSLASRTGLLDLRRREWSDRLLERAGVSAQLLPPLVASGTVIGGVSREAARLTGLLPGTPVCAGGHDHICGAFAAGASIPGVAVDSTGTAEAVLLVLPEPRGDASLCDAGLSAGCHVVPGQYYLIGTILTSGAVVEWLREQLGDKGIPADDPGAAYRALSDSAATVPPGADGLLFLPHLRGSIANPVDPRSRAAFVGLTDAHTRAHLVRAALEGVCHDLRALLARMERLTGARARQLIAVGGAVRNPFWLQLKADVLGRTVVVPEIEEAVALGAALLAGLGVGVYASPDAIRQVRGAAAARYTPRREPASVYRRQHRLYRRLYPALRALSAALTAAERGEEPKGEE